MKKVCVFIVFAFAALGVFSQDIYQIAELGTTDLNGTSRYIGMGGAMGALGGDISTMSPTPAAIGLWQPRQVWSFSPEAMSLTENTTHMCRLTNSVLFTAFP